MEEGRWGQNRKMWQAVNFSTGLAKLTRDACRSGRAAVGERRRGVGGGSCIQFLYGEVGKSY